MPTRGTLPVAIGIYLLLTACFAITMPGERLWSHSPYNHYALQADAWQNGRLDLGGPPPPYTGNNDFAQHGGKHYVSFPPFPAVVVLPAVIIAGSVERVRDGQIFLWLAGIGPALLFVTLERLRANGRLRRRQHENAALAILLGLGTVYWFSAVQGSVWFAAHVVGMALLCGHLACSVEARHPAAAGLLLGLAFATRPTLAFAFPFFAHELWRRRDEDLARRAIAFALPALAVVALVAWHNHARFGDASEFGHRLLAIAWRKRIDTWGLFSPHYLGKNLAVALTGLPFYSPERGLQVNGHGLALWLTTPFYLWAFWPRRTSTLFWAAAAAALAIAIPSLLYQNTGWLQFGYRFSNDYAPLLFLMIALGARRFSAPFWLLAAFAVAVNAFGAVTFGNPAYKARYFIDPSQRIVHQPD